MNGEQSCVCTAGHAPAPLQDAWSVLMPFVHDAGRHSVEPPGNVQAVRFVPLQKPSQTVSSAAHAARVPTGSPEAGEHVPALPVRLQASHWPRHAVLQQTPSTQLPLVHWLLVVQAAPLPSVLTHWPEALQK
jgi:hypothetical protein